LKKIVAALAALFVLLPAPAQAKDPQMMTHAEWVSVKGGMTRAKVNTVCGCIGVLWLDLRPADNTLIYRYLTPVGYAEVDYKPVSGVWRADGLKLWCPGDSDPCEVRNI